MITKRLWVSFGIFCILVCAIAVSSAHAAAPWPLDSDWLSYVDVNWSPIRDITGDESPSATDISSGGLSRTVGAYDSVYVFYSSTHQTIYVRMRLSSDPTASGGAAPLQNYAWAVVFETTQDNYVDWALVVNGMAKPDDAVQVWYNASGEQNQVVDILAWSQSVNPLGGYARVVADGTSASGSTMYFLDWQAPLAAFSSANPDAPPALTESTPLRLFYATGASSQQFNKDIMTGTEIDFAVAATITLGGIGNNRYGVIYDTRDAPPRGGADGTWYRGETIEVVGFGWPYSSGTLHLRILAPNGSTVLWQGTVPSLMGMVHPSPTWNIPCSASYGVYYIQVQDPFNWGLWRTYDRFTIQVPDMAITKSVTPATVESGDVLTYQVHITNTGTVSATVTSLIDVLPDAFSYITGSTTVASIPATDPTELTGILTWTGSWQVAPATSITVSFQLHSGSQAGVFYNTATIYGTNFCPLSTGNAAPVAVTAPNVTVTKTVDKAAAQPGEIVTYTLQYLNAGDGTATLMVITETIPAFTQYVTNSATSAVPITVEFSHDGGASFDTSQLPPVTTVSWHRAQLLPGSGGTVGFQISIQ